MPTAGSSGKGRAATRALALLVRAGFEDRAPTTLCGGGLKGAMRPGNGLSRSYVMGLAAHTLTLWYATQPLLGKTDHGWQFKWCQEATVLRNKENP